MLKSSLFLLLGSVQKKKYPKVGNKAKKMQHIFLMLYGTLFNKPTQE
jgi:hypothetical protein